MRIGNERQRLFQKCIAEGRQMEIETARLLLRMNLVKNGIAGIYFSRLYLNLAVKASRTLVDE